MVLDFLSTAEVGMLVAAEKDAGIEVLEWGLRQRRVRKGVRRVGAAGRGYIPLFLATGDAPLTEACSDKSAKRSNRISCTPQLHNANHHNCNQQERVMREKNPASLQPQPTSDEKKKIASPEPQRTTKYGGLKQHTSSHLFPLTRTEEGCSVRGPCTSQANCLYASQPLLICIADLCSYALQDSPRTHCRLRPYASWPAARAHRYSTLVTLQYYQSIRYPLQA